VKLTIIISGYNKMDVYQTPRISKTEQCPYINDKNMRYLYFLADRLDEDELESVLVAGWRKFGIFYFRPECENCTVCTPIRIPVQRFSPSRSQRRLSRKNNDIRHTIGKPVCDDEIYEVYRDHSWHRFNRETTMEEFERSLCIQSCPSLHVRYYLDQRLVAVGFLDRSQSALSSVYFVFRHEYVKRGLGIYSILNEIELAKGLSLKYLYLGYYIDGNSHMDYKAKFLPHERFDWGTRKWVFNECKPDSIKVQDKREQFL